MAWSQISQWNRGGAGKPFVSATIRAKALNCWNGDVTYTFSYRAASKHSKKNILITSVNFLKGSSHAVVKYKKMW